MIRLVLLWLLFAVIVIHDSMRNCMYKFCYPLHGRLVSVVLVLMSKLTLIEGLVPSLCSYSGVFIQSEMPLHCGWG